MSGSYHIFITRLPKNGTNITLDEWLAYVQNDSELSVTDNVGIRVMWSGCRDRHILWRDGEILANDPEFVLMDKMQAIATALGAVVQGDDLEIYET
jgi:hypothetical protein